MARDRGKQFEENFKECWKQTFPDSFIYRLPDQMSGYKTYSKNPCDFIGYVDGKLFLIECKTHSGASIPFENITQYGLIKSYVGIPGIRCGVVLWLYEKDIGVIYLPISTISKMKLDGHKSFGIRHLDDDKYFSLVLPGQKKRVFWDVDYSPLLDLEEFS